MTNPYLPAIGPASSGTSADLLAQIRAAALARQLQPPAPSTSPYAPVVGPPIDPAAQAATTTQRLDEDRDAALAAANGKPAVPGVDYTRGGAAAGTASGPAPAAGMSAADALRIAGASGGPSVPAHWQPGTRSQTSEGRAPSAELVDAQRALYGANQELAGAGADYEAAKGKTDAILGRYAASYDRQAAADQAALIQRQQAALAQDRDHLTSTLTKAEDATTDPMQWWGSKNTFQKVMTGVQMALQGYLFGSTGRGESPASWIERQIAQSAAQQQADHASKRAAAATAIEGYRMHREALGDDARALEATQLAMRTSVMSRLQQTASDTTAPEAARLRAAQLRQQLAQTNAQQLEAFWDKTADKHTSTSSDTYKAAVQGGAGTPLQVLQRAALVKGLSDKLTGADLETRKGEADLDKSAAEATKLRAEASAAGGKASAAPVAQLLAQEGVPGAQQKLQRFDELTNGGKDIPGTNPVLRFLAGHDNVIAWMRGADAREVDNLITGLAEAKAHASGARPTPETIEYFRHQIAGNGSEVDIQRGIEQVRREIRAQIANAGAAATPQGETEYLARQRAAGAVPPPGFAPGPLE